MICEVWRGDPNKGILHRHPRWHVGLVVCSTDALSLPFRSTPSYHGEVVCTQAYETRKDVGNIILRAKKILGFL